MNESEISELNMELSIRLQKLRRNAGVTQKELAESAGVSVGYISKIERGLIKLSVPMLIDYCRALSLTPNDILLPSVGTYPSQINELLEVLSSMSSDELSKALSIIKIISG